MNKRHGGDEDKFSVSAGQKGYSAASEGMTKEKAASLAAGVCFFMVLCVYMASGSAGTGLQTSGATLTATPAANLAKWQQQRLGRFQSATKTEPTLLQTKFIKKMDKEVESEEQKVHKDKKLTGYLDKMERKEEIKSLQEWLQGEVDHTNDEIKKPDCAAHSCQDKWDKQLKADGAILQKLFDYEKERDHMAELREHELEEELKQSEEGAEGDAVKHHLDHMTEQDVQDVESVMEAKKDKDLMDIAAEKDKIAHMAEGAGKTTERSKLAEMEAEEQEIEQDLEAVEKYEKHRESQGKETALELAEKMKPGDTNLPETVKTMTENEIEDAEAALRDEIEKPGYNPNKKHLEEVEEQLEEYEELREDKAERNKELMEEKGFEHDDYGEETVDKDMGEEMSVPELEDVNELIEHEKEEAAVEVAEDEKVLKAMPEGELKKKKQEDLKVAKSHLEQESTEESALDTYIHKREKVGEHEAEEVMAKMHGDAAKMPKEMLDRMSEEEVTDVEHVLRDKLHQEEHAVEASKEKMTSLAPGFQKTQEEAVMKKHEAAVEEIKKDEEAIETYEEKREETGEQILEDVVAGAHVTGPDDAPVVDLPVAKLEKMDTAQMEDAVNAIDDKIDKQDEKIKTLQDEELTSDATEELNKEEHVKAELEAERDAVDEYREKRHKAAEEAAKEIEDKMHMSGGVVPTEMTKLTEAQKHDVADAVHDDVVDALGEEAATKEAKGSIDNSKAKLTQDRKLIEEHAKEQELEMDEEKLRQTMN